MSTSDFHLDDINGDLIPVDCLYIDPSGQSFDITRYSQVDGAVQTQYAEDAYRDVVMEESSTEDETEDENAYLPKTPWPSHGDILSTAGRTSRPPSNTINQPKLRDINLNTVQRNAVHVIPKTIEQRSLTTAEKHYGTLARTQVEFERQGLAYLFEKSTGYDAEELVLNGAISCSPCRPSDLDYSPTMSIFKDTNFNDTPQDVFEVLKPGLTLAELIMLKGNPRFWIDIACGRRVVDPERSTKIGGRAEILHPVDRITLAHQESTIEELENLGKHLIVRFTSVEGAYACEYHPRLVPYVQPSERPLRRGEFWPCNQRMEWSSLPPHPKDQVAVIMFNRNFLVAAKAFAKQKYPDIAAQLRFTFLFAVNLLHELAHAFEAKCSMGQYYDMIAKDRALAAAQGDLAPFYLPHTAEAKYKDYDLEMGVAWEYETFGTRVGPINSDYQVRYGMQGFLGGGHGGYSAHGLHETLAGRPSAWAVPMGYIEELFQKSYWEKGDPKFNGMIIPRYGPKAHSLNTTSTVDWRQHILENDPMHIAETLEDEFQNLAPSAKRQKQSHNFETKAKGNTPSALQRQWRQTKLKGTTTESARDPAVTVELDSDRMSTAARTELTSDNIYTTCINAQTRLEVNSLSNYIPPSPSQTSIDDLFDYVSTSPAPNIDPLTVPASELSLAQKWQLTEEYALLVLPWTPETFLAKRARLRSPQDMEEVSPRLIPTFNAKAWEDDKDRETLRELRRHWPCKTAKARREEMEREREGQRRLWRVRGEMEEFVVRSGGSRISFMRSMGLGLALTQGMSVRNFNERFRERLLQLRKEQTKAKIDAAVVSESVSGCLGSTGESEELPIPMPTATATTAMTTTATANVEEGPIQGNKITKYFNAVGKKGAAEAEAEAEGSKKRKREECCEDDPATVQKNMLEKREGKVVGPWAELL